MTQTLQERINRACEEVGEDVSFRNGYSGRGMYGRNCVGIVASFAACMSLIGEVTAQLTQELFDASIDCDEGEETAAYNLNDKTQEQQKELLNFSYDSMGYDVIVYWPDLEPMEEPELEDMTDADIDKMSDVKVVEFLKDNDEYLDEEKDSLLLHDIKKTAKVVLARMKADV